jgi:hypothetical protein
MPPVKKSAKRPSKSPASHTTGDRPDTPTKPDESYLEQQARLADEGRGGPDLNDDDNGE